MGAQVAQTARHEAGGGNPVDVEVAEDRDLLASLDGMLETGHDAVESGDEVRVGPVPLKGGRKKVPGLLGGRNAPACHDARGKRGHPAGLLDEPGRLRVEGNDLPAPVASQGRH